MSSLACSAFLLALSQQCSLQDLLLLIAQPKSSTAATGPNDIASGDRNAGVYLRTARIQTRPLLTGLLVGEPIQGTKLAYLSFLCGGSVVDPSRQAPNPSLGRINRSSLVRPVQCQEALRATMRTPLLVLVLIACASLALLSWATHHTKDPAGRGIQLTSNAHKVCSQRVGTEEQQSKKLSDCNRYCLERPADLGRQDCLNICQNEAQAFGRCLVDQTTPRP